MEERIKLRHKTEFDSNEIVLFVSTLIEVPFKITHNNFGKTISLKIM
jgi:hypothetical protein